MNDIRSRYVFRVEDLNSMILLNNWKTRTKGNEEQFEVCPYCGGGGEYSSDAWKFSVNRATGQFHCYRENTCGKSGNFVTFARDFNFPLPKREETLLERIASSAEWYKENILPKQYPEGKDFRYVTAFNYCYGKYQDGLHKAKFSYFDTEKNKPDKTFCPVHTLPNGKLQWKLADCPKRLFVSGNLSADVVILAEGEKDCITLHEKLGAACAVSSMDGATAKGKDGAKWSQNYTEQLRGKTVYILCDNDKAGRNFQQIEARQIYGSAAKVYTIDICDLWADAPDKGDISDMLEAKGIDATKAALCEAMEKQAKEYLPAPQKPVEGEQIEINADAEDIPPDMEEERAYTAKKASEFGEDTTEWAWYPYYPKGDYCVKMAAGGTGKTIQCCLEAAHISAGRIFPGEIIARKPENVLFISAEDRGELLKRRLEACGADLDRVFILDCMDSEGMSFAEDGYDVFLKTIQQYHPGIVYIDPWHAFLGADVDINRVNATRPVFQRLANLAKICNCALVLISHVNKRAQGENANNAATGSTDFINAARSAVQIIFSDEPGEEDVRIMVHTKTNYAAAGRSIKYRINERGGAEWAGFSEITRATLEEAARNRKTPGEILQQNQNRAAGNEALLYAIKELGKRGEIRNVAYDELKAIYGADIFDGVQPKRELDKLKDSLRAEGIRIITGKQAKYEGKPRNGFSIELLNNPNSERDIYAEPLPWDDVEED